MAIILNEDAIPAMHIADMFMLMIAAHFLSYLGLKRFSVYIFFACLYLYEMILILTI